MNAVCRTVNAVVRRTVNTAVRLTVNDAVRRTVNTTLRRTVNTAVRALIIMPILHMYLIIFPFLKSTFYQSTNYIILIGHTIYIYIYITL